MAGIIDKADVQKVREAVLIEDIVSNYVTLERAGSGAMKGLCPFHSEKTPSFNVQLGSSFWHCFGCGEGGDLIDFVMRIEGLNFREAVEFLANSAGITLHYVEGGEYKKAAVEPGTRQRLLDLNRVAQDFFAQQLRTPDAAVAHGFLESKAFSPPDAAQFGVGYAPEGWDVLLSHLRNHGFTDKEITTLGLAKVSQSGKLYDVFRGRVTWPIRDISGAVLGFGARRLDDSQKEVPKYINSPESPIYHKSQVLYGIDLARKDIGAKHQCVVVEGYTDVMAMHLSGVTTAVATCGTAFTEDHAKVIQRLIGTSSNSASSLRLPGGLPPRGGEVIFTFDGDEAGQKAALKAFRTDQSFAAHAFVAVAAEGMDPCDLRVKHGAAGVQELVKQRRPLFDFVLRTLISARNLDNPAGRLDALREAAQIVAEIRDDALRVQYVKTLTGWLGMDERTVWEQVRGAVKWLRSQQWAVGHEGQGRGSGRVPGSQAVSGEAGEFVPPLPRLGLDPQIDVDPVLRQERDALIAVLRYPDLAAQAGFDALAPEAFSQSTLRALFELILSSGGAQAFVELKQELSAQGASATEVTRIAMNRWAAQIREQAGTVLNAPLLELVQRPVPLADDDPTHGQVQPWVTEVVRSLQVLHLRSRQASMNAAMNRLEHSDPQRKVMFTQIVELSEQLRALENKD